MRLKTIFTAAAVATGVALGLTLVMPVTPAIAIGALVGGATNEYIKRHP